MCAAAAAIGCVKLFLVKTSVMTRKRRHAASRRPARGALAPRPGDVVRLEVLGCRRGRRPARWATRWRAYTLQRVLAAGTIGRQVWREAVR